VTCVGASNCPRPPTNRSGAAPSDRRVITPPRTVTFTLYLLFLLLLHPLAPIRVVFI
jgi:hypothetical protein